MREWRDVMSFPFCLELREGFSVSSVRKAGHQANDDTHLGRIAVLRILRQSLLCYPASQEKNVLF